MPQALPDLTDDRAIEQCELFRPMPTRVKGPAQERFEAFAKENPQVLEAIIRLAELLKQRGFRKTSMSLIFERLRWIYAIQTGGDDYKLNNDYRSFYARVVPLVAPHLEGFFEYRRQTIKYLPDLDAIGLGDC